jgi:hypothetical protein
VRRRAEEAKLERHCDIRASKCQAFALGIAYRCKAAVLLSKAFGDWKGMISFLSSAQSSIPPVGTSIPVAIDIPTCRQVY